MKNENTVQSPVAGGIAESLWSAISQRREVEILLNGGIEIGAFRPEGINPSDETVIGTSGGSRVVVNMRSIDAVSWRIAK